VHPIVLPISLPSLLAQFWAGFSVSLLFGVNIVLFLETEPVLGVPEPARPATAHPAHAAGSSSGITPLPDSRTAVNTLHCIGGLGVCLPTEPPRRLVDAGYYDNYEEDGGFGRKYRSELNKVICFLARDRL
jgi:hypothetical protein